MPSPMKPAGSNPLSGRSGSSVLTKAQKLSLFSDGLPVFPLSEDDKALVADAPGKLPTSLHEFVRILHAERLREEGGRHA
jgi:hypothetical protein